MPIAIIAIKEDVGGGDKMLLESVPPPEKGILRP